MIFMVGFIAGCSARMVHTPMDEAATPVPATIHRAAMSEHTLNTAWSLVADGQYAKAEGVLIRWLDTTGPDDDAAHAKALFWLGYCQERQNRPEPARQTYELLITKFPSSPPADQARRRLGRLAGR